MRPTAGDVRKDGKDRQLVIVVPEEQRIVPKKDQAEENDDSACAQRAESFRTRATRLGHLRKKTPNAQRPTPNVGFRTSAFLLIGRSALGVRRFLHKTTGAPSVSSSTFSAMPFSFAAVSRRAGGSSSGS